MSDEKAAAERGPGLVPVIFYLCSGLVALGVMGVLVARYQEIFQKMNVELPVMTSKVLGAGEFVEGSWFICLALLGLTAAPGFIWRDRTKKAYVALGIALLVWSFVLVPPTIFIPIHKLQHVLNEK